MSYIAAYRAFQTVNVVVFGFNAFMALVNASLDRPWWAALSGSVALLLAFTSTNMARRHREMKASDAQFARELASWPAHAEATWDRMVRAGGLPLLVRPPANLAAVKNMMDCGHCPDCAEPHLVRFESGAYGCGNPYCRSIFTSDLGRIEEPEIGSDLSRGPSGIC